MSNYLFAEALRMSRLRSAAAEEIQAEWMEAIEADRFDGEVTMQRFEAAIEIRVLRARSPGEADELREAHGRMAAAGKE